jgi:Tol biopolymer transport system component
MKKISLIVVLLFSIISINAQKQDDFPMLKGPYLGQKPPGNIPKQFTGRISSNINIYNNPVFGQNGNILIFKGTCSSEVGIFIMEQKDGIWLKPRKLLYSNHYSYRHLFLTPDEKRLFFTSRHLINTNRKQKEELKIWVVENDIFGKLKSHRLEFPVNTDNYEFYSTVTQDGTLYFTRSSLNEKACDIYRSKLVDGQYNKVVKLGKPINTSYVDADPFIAPDESYIIFLSDRPGGLGKHDFYISFQEKDSSWTTPKSLGKDINSKANDVCPLVTPDGSFFFFLSNRTGGYETYWVDTKFIEKLKPDKLK